MSPTNSFKIALDNFTTNFVFDKFTTKFNKNKTKPEVCFNSGLEALKVAFLILNDMKND